LAGSAHSHQVLPATRTDVSSLHTIRASRTVAVIAVAAAPSGARARARMLHSAPSLMDRPNTSPLSARSRSSPIAWA